MGRGGLCALALQVFILLTDALPSIPIATDPVLVTSTVPAVIPSLVTIFSVVPATDAAPNALATITTTINGQLTTITPTAVVAGSVTSTIISTVSLTTNQAVVKTVGFSTVFGPDPTTLAVPSISATLVSTSVPATLVTTSSSAPTSNLSAIASTSPTLISATSSSTTTTVLSADGSTSTSSSSSSASASSHSKGLSSGAKAGLAIGVIVGVILLVVLSFLLGQRYSRRHSNLAKGEHDATSAEEKEIFQAGRPYESTGQEVSPAFTPGKGHAYSMNTSVAGSGSPSVSGKSYDMPQSPATEHLYDKPKLSALPQMAKEDDQIFLGVPAHMSGSKRWSTKEFLQ